MTAAHVRVICPECGSITDTYKPDGGVLMMVSHRNPDQWPTWCEPGSDSPAVMTDQEA